MKKFLAAILSLACVFALLGCVRGVSASSVQNAENPASAGVRLEAKEGSVSGSGATFVLVNGTDRWAVYGSPYRLQVNRDGAWQDLEPAEDVIWTMELNGLEPGETTELTVDWTFCYGTLDSGAYRFVKEIGTAEDMSAEYGEMEPVAAEFTIA